MATLYSENPDNFDELEPHLITEFETCKSEIESAALVIFMILVRYNTIQPYHHSTSLKYMTISNLKMRLLPL